MTNNDTITLYHYTNSSGYYGIQASKIIRIARRHALYGSGVYFNSRRVDHVSVTKYDIAKNNYCAGAGANLYQGYVSYIVEVQIPRNEVNLGNSRRSLWVYSTYSGLDLTKYTHAFYPVTDPMPSESQIVRYTPTTQRSTPSSTHRESLELLESLMRPEPHLRTSVSAPMIDSVYRPPDVLNTPRYRLAAAAVVDDKPVHLKVLSYVWDIVRWSFTWLFRRIRS